MNTRRGFMKAAAAGGLAYAFGRTAGTVHAQSVGVGGFNDYKALVCVFLAGGNDCWNMVVPTSTAEYNAYSQSRGGDAGVGSGLAIPQASLLPLSLQGGNLNGVTFGMHPSMTAMQGLFNAAHAAVVANVGPLVRPTTKQQYQTPGWDLPPQLFSHNDQQDQWHSLRGRQLLKTGWGGRVADALLAQTGAQQLPLAVSLAGQTLFEAGTSARPYVMGTNGATNFAGFGASGVALGRRQAFQAVVDAALASTTNTVYERAYATVQQRAVLYADRVNTALAAARSFTALPDSGVTLSSLATQLRTVAKMISVRSQLAMSRQIFFVQIGGFDTHDDLVTLQPGLLGDVSNSIKAFYDALVEMGMDTAVTLFTHSDFGRTLTSNGDGSDHAWGGLQLVVGGAVRGASIYGDYPLLEIGSAQDVGGGRFIPTTSADQYAATLATWFGVADADLPQVAPSLANFSQRNLGFLY
ncbi:MAG TPA: DUF1501 domain-containing protein [Steroidobacteraceae bacterium]|nr:DUF1501 domain-containing protein [Steroidobacteraceae bacterium]